MRQDVFSKWRLAYELGKRFVSDVRGARKAVILVHRNADLDAMGAAAGLGGILGVYGVSWTIAVPEGVNKSVKNLLRKINLKLDIIDCDSVSLSNGYDLVFLVDTASEAQLGSCSDLIRSSRNVILIDHHDKNNLIKYNNIKKYLFSDFSSSSEIVAAIAWGRNIILDDKHATLLYAGIASDSRGFKIVGKLTFEVAGYLVSRGAKTRLIADLSKREPDTSERIAVLKALSRMKIGRACKDILVTVSYVGSFESSVARAMLEAGADVAAVATDTRDGVRVSLRVSERALNYGVTASLLASFIAEKLSGEGGGHRSAGMVHIRSGELTAQMVAEKLAAALPGKVGRICSSNR